MRVKGGICLSFETFAQSDLAMECMNGQFLCGNVITVKYAMKKDGKREKHGSAAERTLAAHMQPAKFIPHTMFSAGAGMQVLFKLLLPLPQSGYYQQMAGMSVPPLPPSHRFSEQYTQPALLHRHLLLPKLKLLLVESREREYERVYKESVS